jgi:hypothetical protein
MRPAKYFIPAAFSLVLVAGVLCSQVCAFDCAFNGCSVSFSLPVQKSTDENGHCHRHKESPTPQKQNDSHRCTGHFDAVLLPSSATSVHVSNNIPDTLGLVAEPFLILDISSQRQSAQFGPKPDRSPPTHSVLRL